MKSDNFSFQYFYSIKDISIGGQCICYGHASVCSPRPNTDVSNSNTGVDSMGWFFFPFESNKLLFYFQRLFCECKHNTCGNNCEKCCEFYYQKPWQPGNNGLKCESRLTFDSFIISQESCEMSFLHYKDQLKMRFSKILIYWYLKISFLVKKKSFKKPILYLIDIFKGLKYYR